MADNFKHEAIPVDDNNTECDMSIRKKSGIQHRKVSCSNVTNEFLKEEMKRQGIDEQASTWQFGTPNNSRVRKCYSTTLAEPGVSRRPRISQPAGG
jgi:hypothetical protein